MFPKDETIIKSMVDGNSLDFYLEDDMFEIEGRAHIESDKIIIDVKNAVGHVLAISGKELEVFMTSNGLCAKRTDTGKVFQMEINRIYTKLVDPIPESFISLRASNEKVHFFKKESDTLIWYDPKESRWYIELNKINMFFSGDRKSYKVLDQLFDSNKENVSGVWQAVSYSSEVEYEEKNYEKHCS